MDRTGNRRFIPIDIEDMDHHKFNLIDKERLFVEAFRTWKGGFQIEILGDEITELNEVTSIHETEDEYTSSIFKWFTIPNNDLDGEWLTVTEISEHINEFRKGTKLYSNHIGEAMSILTRDEVIKMKWSTEESHGTKNKKLYWLKRKYNFSPNS